MSKSRCLAQPEVKHLYEVDVLATSISGKAAAGTHWIIEAWHRATACRFDEDEDNVNEILLHSRHERAIFFDFFRDTVLAVLKQKRRR